jgi:YidC/Oxa1 family membrane protein insertase
MGSMDRNTVIGFVLLAVLLFLYLFLSTKNSQDLQRQKQVREDSIAAVKRTQDSIRIANDTTHQVTVKDTTAAPAVAEQSFVVENEVLKVTFSNKGGQPQRVELKNYKSFDSTPVVLAGTEFDKMSYAVNTGQGQAAQVGELVFQPGTVTKNADNSQTVSFQLTIAGGTIIHQYTLKPGSYLIDWNIQMNGADRLLTQGAFNLIWQAQPMQQEKDVVYERQHTNICFYEDGDFDYILSKTEKNFEKPVQWVSVAQQFFNTTLIAKK